ncbi:catechol 2,3-dioxygenase-like lactoylglutathione lyase family enzyme [Planomicrobium stackebrandtii]|uniref:Catechol 2,3-dioxygenase-like lactoylglutathione lyase family enzyme n=1 Tax=Planomicrobium stackebrandtii TaxID=253160 RepID=A0ABU0GY71_9BACL|nr:VOC family protein [Planomicrobium stackebrandtii]MDQ0430309.1 catechol 2,3-dioxygenase-like lactoylglutathione lyase family enzyme [Planomicrobium stackebrandtii]
MIKGLYEAHLPVSDLDRSIQFYEGLGLEFDHCIEGRVAFLWIEKEKSWLGLWQTEKVELDYHPSIRHIAFQVELEDLKISIAWLKDKGISARKAFGFEPTEPFVMPNDGYGHAKVHFDDPDGNSLEFICKVEKNNPDLNENMYWSDWEKFNQSS